MKTKKRNWRKWLGGAVGVIALVTAGLAINGETEMLINTTHDVDAPASLVWQLFGEEFGAVSDWSAGYTASSLDGPVAAGVMRTIELKAGGALSGTVTQELTAFDRDAKTLTYEMRSGMPPILRGIRNEWTIKDVDGKRSQITGQATFRLAWYVLPLRPLLRKKMTGALNSFAAELGTYVESRAQH